MIEDIKKRLESFGYIVIDSDEWFLGFIFEKVENDIKNDCNVETVPDGLNHIAIDISCGEFLFNKKQLGQLTDFDFEAIAKSIKEGDTNITFAIGDGNYTPEQRFDSLVQYLLNNGKDSFASFRCIKW